MDEIHLHDDVDAKKVLNMVLWKAVNTPTTYTQALENFSNFVENWGFCFWHPPPPPSERPWLTPTWVMGFDGASRCTLHLVQRCSTSSYEQN